MTLLLYWGSKTEPRLGTPRFMLVCLIGAICGSLASVMASPHVVSAGSSGLINALLGSMLVMWLRGDPHIGRIDIFGSLALSILLSLLPSVNWIAYLGAFAGGVLLAAILVRPLQSV